MNDAGSLQNLNDIVLPSPVAWWPPAPGWYVLSALVLVALLVVGVLQWRRWRDNRYRREALAELSSIRASASTGYLERVPELLKRAALSVWPREEVAALTGPDWHRFLDRTAGLDRFCSGAGETLDQLAYSDSGSAAKALDARQSSALLDASELWLKKHKRPAQGG
jgi:hypothetical protein